MKVFRRLFCALVWRYQRQEITGGLITLLGVALGVAVMVAIRLANQNVLDSFENAVDRVAGRANLQIRGDGYPLDERILENLEWLFPLSHVAPVVSGTISLIDHPEEIIEVLGVDLLQDQRIRNYRLVQAQSSNESFSLKKYLKVLTRPNSIFLSQQIAERLNIPIGGEIDVRVDDRVVRLTVIDLLAGDGLSLAMAGQIGLMDIASAQWLFQKFGKVDWIDLEVKEPSDIPKIVDQLRRQCPPHAIVEPPSGRTRQVEKMVSAYQLNLSALSWIALLVGVFLVYNTVSIAVLRRRKDIGVSRALGVPKQWIALVFAIESGFFGLAGGFLGVFLGWALAAGSISAAAETATSFYERVVVDQTTLDKETILIGLITGLGLSLIAGFVPVWEAMAVSPAEASRTGSRESIQQRRALPFTFCGVLSLFLAWWAGLQPAIQNKPVFGFISAALVLIGFTLLSPFSIRLFQRLVKSFMVQVFGSTGRIATANLSSSLGRSSVTVAALMMGLAMTIGMGIMIHSFRRTVDVWVDQTVKSDLWIKAASSQRIEGKISKETIDKIKQVKGVQEIDPYRELRITYKDTPAILGSGQFDVAAKHSHLPIKEGGTTEEVFRKGRQSGWCLVSESFALRHDVKPNDSIVINTPKGQLPLQIAGVYYEYSNDRGYIIIDLLTFQAHFDDSSANVISVYVEPGENVLEVRQRILHEVGQSNPLIVRTLTMLKEEVLRIFDRTFSVTRALQMIAIIVAVLGIVNTQVALVIERKKEIAILRYLGAAVRQIRHMVILEAGLLGVVGIFLGVIAGIALALVLIFVINKQSFGWTIQTHFPTMYIAVTSVLVLIATLLAGIYPATVAAKVKAQEALRGE